MFHDNPMEEALERLAQLERRMNNTTRMAKVTEIDAPNWRIKVSWGKDPEGELLESGWLPWKENAGSSESWDPPEVGEQVTLNNPGGEHGSHSWVERGGYRGTDKPPIHNKPGERVRQLGGKGTWRNHVDKDGNQSITGKGKLVLKFDKIEFQASRIDHNQSGSGGATGVSVA